VGIESEPMLNPILFMPFSTEWRRYVKIDLLDPGARLDPIFGKVTPARRFNQSAITAEGFSWLLGSDTGDVTNGWANAETPRAWRITLL